MKGRIIDQAGPGRENEKEERTGKEGSRGGQFMKTISTVTQPFCAFPCSQSDTQSSQNDATSLCSHYFFGKHVEQKMGGKKFLLAIAIPKVNERRTGKTGNLEGGELLLET